jgi:hypothetical protein
VPETKVTFSTTTGHDHDGSDSKSMSGIYKRLASTTLGAGGATSIDFSSLTACKSYKILVFVKTGNATTLQIRFNNDSGANYNYALREFYAAYGTNDATGQTKFASGNISNSIWTTFEFTVLCPSSSLTKSIIGYGCGNSSPSVTITRGEWTNTADAINRITILANGETMAQYSEVTILGLIS